MAVWQKVNTPQLSFGLRLDPEFYQPKYIKLRNELRHIGVATILDIKNDIRYGLQAEPDYLKRGVSYIRALNLKDIGIEGEVLKIDAGQIPSKDYLSSVGDILITRSGANCGDSCVIDDFWKQSAYGSYIIRIRLKDINPFFVYVFLQSKFGRLQTNQIRTGLAQPNLSIPYIENLIEIPNKVSPKFQEKIENLVKMAFKSQRQIKEIYSEAEQGILERMGWDRLERKHVLSYSVSSKSILENERFDPEFYQPKFEHLLRQLNKAGSKRVRELCLNPKRGVSPSYYHDGDVAIVNSQHLSESGVIDIENLHKTNEKFYSHPNNVNARLSKFDVLVYATGAYIGRANCWLEDRKAIAGVDCIIIQPDKKICNPIYLALFLNSPAGLLQATQRASGSAQRHLYPKDIKNYEVFIPQNRDRKPDLAWQDKLADKVIQANLAKKEAKQKLQEAKELVEKEIDKMIK